MPIRVQLPDGNIGEFPDGMKPGEIEAVLRKQFPPQAQARPASATPAQPQKAGVDGNAAGRFALGLAQGAISDTASGLWHAVTSPVQAIKSIGERHGELAAEAVLDAEKGNYVSALGKGISAAIPLAGPAIEMATSRIFPRGNDQLGDAQEVGRGLGNVAALIAGPKVVEKGAAAVKRGVQNASSALRASAEQQYGRALNPTTKGNKARTAEVVPELLDRRVQALTMKGLSDQVKAKVESYGQAIEDAWAGLPEGTAVDIADLAKSIEARAVQEHTVTTPSGTTAMGPAAEAAIAESRALVDTLRTAAEKRTVTDASGATTTLEVLPAETLHRFRQYFDNVAKEAGRYDGKTLRDASRAQAHAAAADAIRNEISGQFPDIAKLNKEFSFWRKVDQVVGDTILRRQGQEGGLVAKVAAAGGTIAGAVNAGVLGGVIGRVAMGALERGLQSPAWRTASAVTKARLADAIAAGRGAEVFRLVQPFAKTAQQGVGATSTVSGLQPAFASADRTE